MIYLTHDSLRVHNNVALAMWQAGPMQGGFTSGATSGTKRSWDEHQDDDGLPNGKAPVAVTSNFKASMKGRSAKGSNPQGFKPNKPGDECHVKAIDKSHPKTGEVADEPGILYNAAKGENEILAAKFSKVCKVSA